MQKSLLKVGLLVVALLALPGKSLLAAEKTWMHTGQVDSLDLANQFIMVNDMTFKIIPTSKTSSDKGKTLSIQFVNKGDMVGVDYRWDPTLGKVLVEMQVYPKGSRPKSNAED